MSTAHAFEDETVPLVTERDGLRRAYPFVARENVAPEPMPIGYVTAKNSHIEDLLSRKSILGPGWRTRVANTFLTSSTVGSCTISATLNPAGNTSTRVIETELAGADDSLAGYDRYAAPNWDGYGADPITLTTLTAARGFLKILPRTFGEPDIAPGADGTIGLEWVFNNRPLRKLFIDVGPGQVWSGFWRRASGEKKTIPTTPITAATQSDLAGLFRDLNF
jgi:hypothetical protein